ncbi:MAG: methyltransferase [bacterium]
MTEFLLIFLAVFQIVLVIVAFLLVLWMWSLTVTGAPFVPIPTAILPEIIKALDLKDDDVFYDLGCGDGRVLIAVARERPMIKCVGVEKAIFPYWTARYNVWRSECKNIKIVRNNMFKEDLSKATKIFTYLFPKLMDRLFGKLNQEVKTGLVVVSCDFQFSKKEPEVVIDLHRPDHALGRMLRVYNFL